MERLAAGIGDLLDRRRLAEAALVLRSTGSTGSYPAALPPELARSQPGAGRPPVYTLRPDGSAVLRLVQPIAGDGELVLPPPPRRRNQR